ncbi:hypothetical protein [Streptomyces sp. NK08204]|uniref:hypothetical protein n=1 Tax=Streptomyces sp. NK08204 TaxID=2873260 RepID=UPI001CEC692F|nr:hypothetical protein [Streptomyces sp. NK08204]
MAVILLVCIVAAGSVTAWFLTRDDSPDFCRELASDSRVEPILAAAHGREVDCATLGRTLKGATTGRIAEKHSLKQAQAMKNTLLAIDDRMQKLGVTSLDAEFSTALADALVDYPSDIYGSLAPSEFDHWNHNFPWDPPWEEDGGVHMAVPEKPLMRVMRGLSATPSAYAELRLAVTRSAAHELATTPDSTNHSVIAAAPKTNARALAALDAIADNVTGSLGKEQAADWKNRVFTRLTQVSGSVPPYDKDPEHNITGTWQKDLKSAGNGDLSASLYGQGPVLVKVWGKGNLLKEEQISSLADDARFSAESARITWAHNLEQWQ